MSNQYDEMMKVDTQTVTSEVYISNLLKGIKKDS